MSILVQTFSGYSLALTNTGPCADPEQEKESIIRVANGDPRDRFFLSFPHS